jgi:hypothetical protein
LRNYVASGFPSAFGGTTLKRVEEYRRYAAECRDMARTAPLAHLAAQIDRIINPTANVVSIVRA